MVNVVPALEFHIHSIAANIRESDRLELWASAHIEPLGALWECVKTSQQAWTVFMGDEAVCMFGVAADEHSPVTGRPWMVGTTLLERHAYRFLIRCKKYLASMLDYFPLLENYVWDKNIKAMYWLVWLGFAVRECAQMGPDGETFWRFDMVRP